jgi:hypothetical protein
VTRSTRRWSRSGWFRSRQTSLRCLWFYIRGLIGGRLAPEYFFQATCHRQVARSRLSGIVFCRSTAVVSKGGRDIGGGRVDGALSAGGAC